ncbi:hypothetical protein HD553DRAFT_342708 [Filobasidium floriforme]|uniref:uncharacterized protein n=1 Tax=Filobasidium floriforme TaxID=5210 RepID=UPI001E8D060E|nr:uncharacterized protein HD553DRAFT_342708 [Filobasidium floriforme]KAH8083487.1 hypothetical protein HD553DRAFT_342708 [Filobasidium floriforme]
MPKNAAQQKNTATEKGKKAEAPPVNAAASGSGARKRPAPSTEAIPPPTTSREVPPADFQVKNLLALADNVPAPEIYVWDSRFGTVQAWWREISSVQKVWAGKRGKNKGEFPALELDLEWKAMRCSTGAYVVWNGDDAALHRWLIQEEDRKLLPVPPPNEWKELTTPGRSGDFDTTQASAWLGKWKGGWRLICPSCKEKYGTADGDGLTLPEYLSEQVPPAKKNFIDLRQNELPDQATGLQIDSNPLILACSYGGVGICRSAHPLDPGSAFSSCGPCKSAGTKCNGGLGDEWNFNIDDNTVAGVLRLAKIVLLFAQGTKWTTRAARDEQGEKAFEILREGICHGQQGLAIEGEDPPTHDATPTPAIVEMLKTFPKKEQGKGKGKAKAE